MSDFTENDLRQIECDRDLPPDELHPRGCPECGSADVHDGAEWDNECLDCGHLWAAA